MTRNTAGPADAYNIGLVYVKPLELGEEYEPVPLQHIPPVNDNRSSLSRDLSMHTSIFISREIL